MWRNFSAASLLMLAALLFAAGCPAKRSEEPASPTTDSPAIEPAPPGEAELPPSEPTPPAENQTAAEPAAEPAMEPATEPAAEPIGEPADETPTPEPAASPEEEEETEPAGTGYNAQPNRKQFAVEAPIFENWPQPQAAILISGEQYGFMEPCGCAGLENQKGGLKRRHTLIESLQAQGWPVVPVDLGGQVRRFGRQAEIKFGRTADALVTLGYQAVGFGPQELRLPAEHLLSVAANLAEGRRNAKPFVSANVGILDFDLGYVERFRVVEAGGRKIGITSILGPQYRAMINNDDILYLEPEKALAEIIGPMSAQADFLVLLSHASPEQSQALAKKFPQFNVVVTAGGAEEPPRETATVPGTETQLVEVGHKGMYVAVLGLYDDAQQPIRYQRVPLDARFEDSNEMQAMLVSYQKELETLGLAGLDVKPQAHPSGNQFIGSHACADCHSTAHEIWSNSPHAHATQTLVDLKPARHFDPECLSCHVTGWDPQNYYPYFGGYTDLDHTELLRDNGCENCHGPGSAHVAAELGEIDVSDKQRNEFREQMRLRLVEGEAEGKVIGKATSKCLECHDLDNSPDFDFKTYWPHIEHRGLD